MTRKILSVIVAVMAALVGLYPFIYFFVERNFGLLQSKSNDILTDTFWNIGFYMHITMGGLALLVGWTQFITKLRTNRVQFHRSIGKIYVIAALLSAVAGLYIAFYATGGMIASLGFTCLAIIWFYCTLRAYIEIRNKRVDQHQKMMTYSYAACFAAVTLRIYLPLLIMIFHDFITAYLIVAWLCWVPNMIVAYFLVRRIGKQENNDMNNIKITIIETDVKT